MTSLREMMRAIREEVRIAIAERTARKREARPIRASRLLRRPRTRKDDEPIVLELLEWHRRLNGERFDGKLSQIVVRVSRRMRSRLGHYSPAQRGAPAEIAISWHHIRRHGFAQAVHTLLHEMVHQWQDESRIPLDHGPDFRRKAREVGITARASRAVD
jgi:SprT-like family